MKNFGHENLDVYRIAIQFVIEADEIAASLPRGRAYLVDQLRRAATSIPLNIAEGAGEYCVKDKARFYRIARRSATECAAVLDICNGLQLVGEGSTKETRQLLLRVVSMLTKMAKSGTGTGTGTGTGRSCHATADIP